MRNLKRFLALSLSATMCLSLLSACGDKKSEEVGKDGDAKVCWSDTNCLYDIIFNTFYNGYCLIIWEI